MDVQYNDPMYSYCTLWNALHTDNVINDTYAAVEIKIGGSFLIKLSKYGKSTKLLFPYSL